MASMHSRSPARSGFTWAQTKPERRSLAACSGGELRGGFGDGDTHQGFGLLLGGQVVRVHGIDFGGPVVPMGFQGHTGEDGIGGCADGAALETEI